MNDVVTTPVGGDAGRLLHRAAPWLLALAVGPLSFLAPGRSPFMIRAEAGESSPVWVLAFSLALAVMIGTVMARRRRWPLLLAATAGWLTLGMWAGLFTASYYVGTVWRRAAVAAYALGASLLVFVPMMAGFYVYADGSAVGYTIGATACVTGFVGLPLAVGLWTAARRALFASVAERAVRAEAEQAARAEAARVRERARIAREMHDVLAHRVSLMVLHAGALEVNAPDKRTRTGAGLIRDTGRQALTDLRSLLGVLRSPDGRLAPQPTLADLDALLEHTRAAGTTVERRDSGVEGAVPETVQRAIYRVVREALTNVHKHAGDATTQVALDHHPDGVRVRVTNAPPSHPVDPMPGSGLGLVGLRERVELLGGEFEARRRLDGGFEVSARFPLNEERMAVDT